VGIGRDAADVFAKVAVKLPDAVAALQKSRISDGHNSDRSRAQAGTSGLKNRLVAQHLTELIIGLLIPTRLSQDVPFLGGAGDIPLPGLDRRNARALRLGTYAIV
jgi:hypothetical protein